MEANWLLMPLASFDDSNLSIYFKEAIFKSKLL